VIIIPRPSASVGVTRYTTLSELIDTDGSATRWTQAPTVRVEIRQPGTGRVLVARGVDSLVRSNSFDQRSQTCDLVLHDVPDWIRGAGKKPIHALYGIKVFEGYGGLVTRTFNGVVTSADYSNAPAEVRLSCSDRLYLARQQFLLSVFHYENWAADDAIRDLLGRSGISPAFINIGADGTQALPYGLLPAADAASGKNGANMTFQSPESALSHICDLFGYRFWCDLSGTIEVQYVRPFPTAQATMVPVHPAHGEPQKRLAFLSAPIAQARYSDASLGGNLLKVVSHSLSAQDMRNFIGVYDGFHDPLYVSAAPGVPGFPQPLIPSPRHTDAAALLATHNPPLPTDPGTGQPMYTAAAMVASDLISWDSDVLSNPNDPASAHTTMQAFLANRILGDLNRETEGVEFLTFGLPYADIGMTVEVQDPQTFTSGMFFVTGFQTRISGSGYTTQLKCVGGPAGGADYPRPRPQGDGRKGHDGVTRAIIRVKDGFTIGGAGGTYSVAASAWGGA
jgi:hypothetical protein